MQDTRMNRRELIERVAWLMGGAISAPAVLGVLSGCSPKPGSSWQPLFLSKEEGAIVEEVADLILPGGGTPGAREVGVPAFIDVILKDAYPTEDQARFVSGLKDFDAEAQRVHGKPFLELDATRRLAFLQHAHDTAAEIERTQQQDMLASQRKRPFVLMMKELTLLGFFTSQAGATKVLQYEPVPGGFQACIPVAQAGNGRTWATETSLRF
jgi:hypothetical protein